MATSAVDGALLLIIDAAAFAAHKHRNQRRKDEDATPYINHPLALAHILAIEGRVKDPATLAAAVLHDTVEDTETTLSELEQRFGKTIAGIVAEVTDDKALPKATRKHLQIEHAPHMSKRAKLVKLADKIANLRDVATHPPKDWPTSRRVEYFDWAKQVVDGIGRIHPRLQKIFDEAYAQRP